MSERNTNSLGEHWNRMTPANRRFVVWCGVVLAAIAGTAGWYRWGRVTRVPLLPHARLVDDDLARMQLAFGKAGLSDFQIRGRQVYVDQTKQDLYLKALAEQDALPDISHSLYEPESSADFWSNRQQQHEKSLVRKKKMIRQMIMQLEFVADAHVDLDELTEPGFPPKTSRKLAVVVRPRAERILERHQVRAIRDTVLGQVAGLERRDVVITDIAAGHAYNAETLDDGALPAGDSLVWLEQARLTQRLTDWLARYSPTADINVRLVEVESQAASPSPAPIAAVAGDSAVAVATIEPPPTVLVNQPVSIAEEQVADPAASNPPTSAHPAPLGRHFIIQARVHIPCDCQTTLADATRPLAESQRRQLESSIAAELRPLLACESLPCQVGTVEVTIEPQPISTAPAAAQPWGTALGWTRQNSLWALLVAGAALLGAVAWLLRPRSEPQSEPTPAPQYSARVWEARERAAHIPLNDETRQRLRKVVSDDPDRAAEIIKNWIRDAA